MDLVWSLTRGVTWDIDVVLGIDLTTFDVNADEIWFTWKNAPGSDSDDNALLQVTYSGGLMRLNRAIAATPTDATLTITDAVTGTVHLHIEEDATRLLPLLACRPFDFAVLLADDKHIPVEGALGVPREVTRALRRSV